MTLAAEICRHNRSHLGDGCPNPLIEEGTCGKCRNLAVACSAVADAVNGKPQSRACFCCRREAYAFLKYKGREVCAMCAPHAQTGEMMIRMTDAEAEAMDAGGARGGEYLDELGLGALFERVTAEQWRQFLSHVLDGYSEAMQATAQTEPPF